MKGISDLFIFRPVMTTLVMLGILIFGITAYRKLPVSNLPSVDFPTIQVSATLPGANPDTMASAVATPLEKQFSTISGIDSMTSSSVIGRTSITLQFNLSRDLDAAAQDVQAAISGALGKLPDDNISPLFGPIRIEVRIVCCDCFQNANKHSRLFIIEFIGRSVEISACSSMNSVCIAPETNSIEVHLQNFILGIQQFKF